MPKSGRQRGLILNVCKECGQSLPSRMEIIPKVLERLRKEMDFGKKCEIK